MPNSDKKHENTSVESSTSSKQNKGRENHPASEAPKDGSNYFSNLPPHVKEHIASFSKLADTSAIARTEKAPHKFFTRKGGPLDDASKLLQYVAFGETAKVDAMLKINPNLAECRRIVRDRSDRVFEDITPLQYTAWALNQDMYQVIKKHMTDDQVRAQLRQHLNEEDPPTYVKTHGAHFDVAPLVTAYQNYINRFNQTDWSQSSNVSAEQELGRLWFAIIKEQKKIPVGVCTGLEASEGPFAPHNYRTRTLGPATASDDLLVIAHFVEVTNAWYKREQGELDSTPKLSGSP